MDEVMPRVSPDWLALREPADAAARSAELVAMVRAQLAGPLVIHDLGCGTGSMRRWLAPYLPGPQHWILHDRDRDLLDRAAAAPSPGQPAGRVSTHECDVSELTAADFAGAGLVTASALLDLLTEAEVDRIAAACAGAGCPALLTLSVAGRVELSPADPRDTAVAGAFNAHQRRTVGGRRLLGPDAVDAAVAAFHRRGITTARRSSPWRLDPTDTELIGEWFEGWWGAAIEQQPELFAAFADYGTRRRTELAEGRLAVVVHHDDLLTGTR